MRKTDFQESIILLRVDLTIRNRLSGHVGRQLMLVHLLVEEVKQFLLRHSVGDSADIQPLALAEGIDAHVSWRESTRNKACRNTQVKRGRHSTRSISEHT